MKKRLNREKQCAKCPWKISTDPHDIPNGYSVQKHQKLVETIASGDMLQQINQRDTLRAMACHESQHGEETPCLGWLFNQLGPGNNLMLRLKMLGYDLSNVELDGEQHQRFEDTLP